MEELTKEAEAKLQMLRYTNGKTPGIVEKGNLGAVARHRNNLQALVKEVDALKLRVEQTMFEAGVTADLDRGGPNPLADMDPPSQIWTPLPNFPFKLFCRCSFQSQHNISSIKVKKQQQQPFRSNSTAFILASRTVYASIRCEQTTAFELLKLLQ